MTSVPANSATDQQPDADFPIVSRMAWLNHAAVSPWPRAVAAAVESFLSDNITNGPVHYARWLQVEAETRSRLARLLGDDDPDNIAFVANTSTGLNLVASGIDWRHGDRVVVPAGEFPSNRLPWTALGQHGVEVVEVSLDGDEPEAALLAAIDERTRLVSVSAVRFDSGLRLELARIGQACRSCDALFCIDAIQQLGALQLDALAIQADFIVAGSHKWLLSPEGLGLFWSRPQARQRLRQSSSGWRMFADPFRFEREDSSPPGSARRFEPGTLNTLGIHALHAATGLLLDVGMETVERELLSRQAWLQNALSKSEIFDIITPADPTRHSGIFSIRHRQLAAARIVKRLAAKKVYTAARGNWVRLSPHFYTPFEQLEKAVSILEGF